MQASNLRINQGAALLGTSSQVHFSYDLHVINFIRKRSKNQANIKAGRSALELLLRLVRDTSTSVFWNTQEIIFDSSPNNSPAAAPNRQPPATSYSLDLCLLRSPEGIFLIKCHTDSSYISRRNVFLRNTHTNIYT